MNFTELLKETNFLEPSDKVFEEDPLLAKIKNRDVEEWVQDMLSGSAKVKNKDSVNSPLFDLAKDAKSFTKVFIIGEAGNKEFDELKSSLLSIESTLFPLKEQIFPRPDKGDVMILIEYLEKIKTKEPEEEVQAPLPE